MDTSQPATSSPALSTPPPPSPLLDSAISPVVSLPPPLLSLLPALPPPPPARTLAIRVLQIDKTWALGAPKPLNELNTSIDDFRNMLLDVGTLSHRPETKLNVLFRLNDRSPTGGMLFTGPVLIGAHSHSAFRMFFRDLASNMEIMQGDAELLVWEEGADVKGVKPLKIWMKHGVI